MAARGRGTGWATPWSRLPDASRLAVALPAVHAAVVLGTAGALDTDRRGAVAAYGVGALVLALLARGVPWDRGPAALRWVPALTALAAGPLVLGAAAGVSHHLLLLSAATGLYVGLALPAGASWRLLPLLLLGTGVALAGAQRRADVVDLVGAVVLQVLVAEVLARVLLHERTTRAEAQRLLAGVQALHAERTESGAADAVAALAVSLLQPDVAVTMVAVGSDSPLYTNRGQQGVDVPLGHLVVDATGVSGLGLAMTEGRALFLADAARSPLLARTPFARLELATVLFVPVPGEHGWLGCVVVGWKARRDRLDGFGEQVVSLLSSSASTLLERLRSVGQLQQQARTDALTGLPNRRVFLEALDRLRPGGAVLFLDLDHFKALNDTLGHAAGDDVLRAFGAVLRRSVRDGDCAARYGGEEFAIVLPGDGETDLRTTAEHVVARIRERWDGPTTFSVGVAVHRAGDPPATTLARADEAVYAAKAAGRDRLVHAGG